MSIGIGLLGCGLVTQHLHIPALQKLDGLFHIAALHDASPTVTSALAARLPGATAHRDVEALLDDPSVAAVLIAGPSALHAAQAVAAMRAGKHVLIEKPVCMTTAEVDAVAEVQRQTGRIAQVGYMRRHALGFGLAKAEAELVRGTINMARVVEVSGPNAGFVAPTATVITAQDIPEAKWTEARAANDAALIALVGTAEGPAALTANLLLGLSTHSLSTMRGLLGMPQVVSAHVRRDGRFINATFDHGGFLCQFETGIDQVPRFGAHIDILAEDRELRLSYGSPFLRNDPARLRIVTADDEDGTCTVLRQPRHEDPFISEWRSFHRTIAEGAAVQTPLADASEDHVLIEEILRRIAR